LSYDLVITSTWLTAVDLKLIFLVIPYVFFFAIIHDYLRFNLQTIQTPNQKSKPKQLFQKMANNIKLFPETNSGPKLEA